MAVDRVYLFHSLFNSQHTYNSKLAFTVPVEWVAGQVGKAQIHLWHKYLGNVTIK